MPHYQDLSAPPTPAGFRGRNKALVQLWYLTRSILFACSPVALNSWRLFLLRLFGAKIGKGVTVRPSSRILYPWNLRVGNYTYIADDVNIYSLDQIEIGDHVSVSFGAVLCAGTHDMTASDFPLQISPIKIENEVWIGAQVFVMPGLVIGRGAVIGARSLLSKTVSENQVWAGAPAKFVRLRLPQDESVSAAL